MPTPPRSHRSHPTDIDLATNAHDGDSDPLTYSVVTDGNKGTVTFSGSTATYTPTGQPTGTDTFTYKVNDGLDNSTTATVTVTFNKVPTANDDNAGTIAATHATTINLAGKTSDGDSDPLTYAVVTDATKGHVTFTGSTARYTPNGTGAGPDTFTYRVNDGLDNSTTATVTVVVNNAPTASNDNAGKISANQPTNIDLAAKTSDADSDPLTYAVVTDATKGHVTFTGSTAKFTPNGTGAGPDTFTYRVNDGLDNSTTATVTVNVNAAPTATGASRTVAWKVATDIPLAATDGDGGPNALAYSIVGQATHGSAVIDGGSATYTPDPGFSGSDSFTFKVNDGLDDSNIATIAVMVAPDRAPQATGSSVSVPFQGAKTITLQASDADPSDRLKYKVISGPRHGRISTGIGATRTYTAGNGYVGTDSFSFRANDGTLNSGVATVKITVSKASTRIVAVQFVPAHPTSGQIAKAVVTLSTPGTANGGRVALRQGKKSYAAKVIGKKATVTLGRLPGGAYHFSVRFGGTRTTHTTQVSASSLTVSRVVSALHVSSSPQQLTTTSRGTAIVKVSAPHAHTDGVRVTIKQGSRTIGSGRVKHGVARIALPQLSLGQHNLTVHYAGTSTAAPATQTWIARVALG